MIHFVLLAKNRTQWEFVIMKTFSKGRYDKLYVSRPDIKQICVNSNRLLYNDESINTDNYTITERRDVAIRLRYAISIA